jgi:hypothetical protein
VEYGASFGGGELTKLVVEELKTTLVQDFSWNLRTRAHAHAFRPHLYVHNAPAGAFTLAVLDSVDTVLGSGTFASADVYSGLGTANLYAHAYFRVDMTNMPPLHPGSYKLRLSSSGYTFSESAYLGWVRDHEDLKAPIDGAPASDLNNPMSFEMWVYQ